VIPAVPEAPRVRTARFTAFFLVLELEDGRELHMPLKWAPWLHAASPDKQGRFELSQDRSAIRWLDLDEELHVVDLLYPATIAVAYR
jgi:hypothetical protein